MAERESKASLAIEQALIELERRTRRFDPSVFAQPAVSSLLQHNPTAGQLPGNLPAGMPRRTELPGVTLGNAAQMGALALADSAGDMFEVLHGASQRDPTRAGIGAASLAVPFLPVGVIRGLRTKAFRGGAEAKTTGFFSRDKGTAEGFAKGSLGKYDIRADKVLSFSDVLTPEDAKPIFRAMRDLGDKRTADRLERIIEADGGVEGGLLYTLMEINGAASPELILKNAGIEAIDTGRDIRVISPGVARLISERLIGGK